MASSFWSAGVSHVGQQHHNSPAGLLHKGSHQGLHACPAAVQASLYNLDRPCTQHPTHASY